MKLKRIATALMTGILLSTMTGCETLFKERYDIIVFGTGEEMSYETEQTYLGAVNFAEKRGMKVKYCYPSELTREALSETLRVASNYQPKYYLFADPIYSNTVYTEQGNYMSSGWIYFACFGFKPTSLNGEMQFNLLSCLALTFDEDQTGYICGATVAMEYTSIGYVSSESEKAYLDGFERGVNEQGKPVLKGRVEDVAAWYDAGVEVVYAVGEQVEAILPIAEEKGGKIVATNYHGRKSDAIVLSSENCYDVTSYATLANGESSLSYWTLINPEMHGYGGNLQWTRGLDPVVGIKTIYYKIAETDYVSFDMAENLKDSYEKVRETIKRRATQGGKVE